MEENHKKEQYFFDGETVTHLANIVKLYSFPCCLCAPTLGAKLEDLAVECRVLDIDDRFSQVKGFKKFDLTRPQWMGEPYGIILVDPPFFNAVPTHQLFVSVRMLAMNNFQQPLLISWLRRRAANLLKAFSEFNLEPTGFCPGYISVANEGKNEIEFYGNLGSDMHRALAGSHTVDGESQ